MSAPSFGNGDSLRAVRALILIAGFNPDARMSGPVSHLIHEEGLRWTSGQDASGSQ
jgi:hypothetical protein